MSLLELQGFDPDVVAGHGSSLPGSVLSVTKCGHRRASLLSVLHCSAK
ncbi:SapB/AmfS family lanthipeptide [Streptomyces albicerus]|nr:SapB/AmfS family lanthipeptide [Streptomyces albicerus]